VPVAFLAAEESFATGMRRRSYTRISVRRRAQGQFLPNSSEARLEVEIA
jgi:hypothetical protein